MRGGRAVAVMDVKAHLGTTREGTERMDQAAVVTDLDSVEIPAECKRRSHVPHEEWNDLRNPLTTPTFLDVDRIGHRPIRPPLDKSMSAVAQPRSVSLCDSDTHAPWNTHTPSLKRIAYRRGCDDCHSVGRSSA